MATKPELTQEELEALMYAGATPYEDEDEEAETTNRGDEFEPTGDVEPSASADADAEDPAPEAPAAVAEEPVAEEPVAEVEVEAEVEAEEPKPELKADDTRMIPKKRFDEINERRKAAERRNLELEAEKKANDPTQYVDFDFDAKEELYAQRMLDGDVATAKDIRAEIRRAEQVAFEKMAEMRANKVMDRQKMQNDFDATIVELTAMYPAYDPESPYYDQDLVDEAKDTQLGLMERGYTPAVAMRRAAQYAAAIAGLQPVTGGGLQSEAPVTPSATVVPIKKPDIAKKLAAAEKQPPKQQGRNSATEGLVDLSSISEEEFDALPESKLRALRGDMRM